MSTRKYMQGSVHAIVAIVAIVGILGVLGFVGYGALTKKQVAQVSSSEAKEDDAAEHEHKLKEVEELDKSANLTKEAEQGSDKGQLKADASGAYSSICGAGFNLRYTSTGNGFKVYNYKRSDGRGCALMVNSSWGKASYMTLKVGYHRSGTFVVVAKDIGTYKYYAGPIYYKHTVGFHVYGKKGSSETHHAISAN